MCHLEICRLLILLYHQADELKPYRISHSHFYNSEGNYFNFVILLLLGKDAIYTIPVKNILAVEKLEESSFNKKNVSVRNN